MTTMYGKKKSAMLVLTIILAIAMLVSACGNNNNAGNTGGAAGGNNASQSENNTPDNNASNDGAIDTSEHVTLKMIMLGGKPIDHDMVFTEINKILKEKINATVEVEYLDWSDWQQKYPLKFAASEDFDIAYTANWAYYNDQALKGGFMEITEDMLKKYAPMTWEAMNPAAWDQAKVNGKLYMVPHNNTEIIDKAIIYREDLRKKYNLDPITDLESYATYLKTIAANEKGITPFGAKAADGWKWHELDQASLEQANDINLVSNDTPLAYDLNDPEFKLFNIYESPQFKELLQYYKDLADNGAWSRNVVSNKNDTWTDMKAGKVASYAHNIGTIASNLAEARRDVPELEFALADLTPNSKKLGAISTQNGTGIHAISKNPERALMFIDLMQNDRQLHDLIYYGIEGVHFNAVGDDKLESTSSTPNYTGHSVWGFNSPLNRTDVSYPDEASAISADWETKLYNFKLETFVFDDSKVKNQIANIGNVMLRYAIPLEYGLIDDLDKGLAELNKQLKAAGIDAVQAEMQAQVDAFLAAQ